jgi:hypothetical protein
MVRRIRQTIKQAMSFRERLAQVEAQRAAIIDRLEKLGPGPQSHPAYRNIRRLLGTKFITSTLAQRIIVLQSAEWLLNVLETISMM